MITTLLRGFGIISTFFYEFVFFIFSYFPHLFGYLSLAFVENPGPQGKLGFLDFSPITEIDGVNFGSHMQLILGFIRLLSEKLQAWVMVMKGLLIML